VSRHTLPLLGLGALVALAAHRGRNGFVQGEPADDSPIGRRYANISAATGVPVNILRALSRVESNHDDTAVRFECHLFNDRGYSVPCTPSSRGRWSTTRSETNKAAAYRAAQTDPDAAVRSSSWGRYQVMGSTALAATGWTAEQFLAAFDAAPADVSDEIAIGWWARNQNAVRAAQAGDLETLTRRYNGASSEEQIADYSNRLRNALG
jgi:hypothetical protein